jgi:hypothetical protein
VRLAPVHALAFLVPQPVVLRLCGAPLSICRSRLFRALSTRCIIGLLAAAHGLVIRGLQLQRVVTPPLEDLALAGGIEIGASQHLGWLLEYRARVQEHMIQVDRRATAIYLSLAVRGRIGCRLSSASRRIER